MLRARHSLLACAATALAAAAFAQDDADAAFDRTPRDCINSAAIDTHLAVDDQNLLFYMRDKRVYRNHLPRKCPGLERENRISYKLQGTQRLCSINTITVLEDGIGGGGPFGFREGFTCRLGEFVPLSEAEIEDLLLMKKQPRGRRTQSTIETSEVDLPDRPEGESAEPAAAEADSSTDDRED